MNEREQIINFLLKAIDDRDKTIASLRNDLAAAKTIVSPNTVATVPPTTTPVPEQGA